MNKELTKHINQLSHNNTDALLTIALMIAVIPSNIAWNTTLTTTTGSPADKTLQLHDSTLMASTTVRNLGVQLDSELNFDIRHDAV